MPHKNKLYFHRNICPEKVYLGYRAACMLIFILMSTLMLTGCTGTLLLEATGTSLATEQLADGRDDAYPEISILDSTTNARRLVRGEAGPAFKLAYADGTIVSSAALQGKPILINFWATWCGPCRREMPAIVAEAETHEELVVIAVNQLEARQQIDAFVEEFQMNTTIIVARDVEGKIGRGMGVTGLPTTVFIDRNGDVSAVWSGYLSREMLQDFLIEIL